MAAVEEYFERVSKNAIAYRNPSGIYGTATDPRIATASKVSGDGRAFASREERFRIERGVTLVPLCILPHATADTAGPVDKARRVLMGAVVTGIKHGFGYALPQGVILRASADAEGPIAQKVEIAGGTANTLVAGYANGERVRCEIDFIPILGRTTLDIRRKMEFLFQFTSGVAATGEFDWALPAGPTGQRYFDGTALPEAVISELVTTRSTFGGILVATHWGLGSFVSTSAFYSGAPANTLNLEGTTARLGDTIQGHQEIMACAATTVPGKAFYAFRVNPWQVTITLQDIFNDGLRLFLAEGSIDFVMR